MIIWQWKDMLKRLSVKNIVKDLPHCISGDTEEMQGLGLV